MMLVTHVICGVILGSGAALALCILGLPVWAVILAYVLWGSLGVLASALATRLFPPDDLAGLAASLA
jgi:uncharacterized membrane protein